MIKDIKKYLKSLKYFKIILVFIIAIFSLSLGTIDKKTSIITGVNSALSYNLIIFILLSVFISNTLFLNRNLFNNYSYILRFKDKNTVLNNNIAISNFINFKFYLEAIIVIFIAVFMFFIFDIRCSQVDAIQCTIEDNVSINEVYDKYNVVDKQGEIWTLREKTEK